MIPKVHNKSSAITIGISRLYIAQTFLILFLDGAGWRMRHEYIPQSQLGGSLA